MKKYEVFAFIVFLLFLLIITGIIVTYLIYN